MQSPARSSHSYLTALLAPLALFASWLSLPCVTHAADATPRTPASPPASAPAQTSDPDAVIGDQLDAARDLLDAGKWKEARDAFRRASQKSPRSVTAMHGEGLAGLQMNDDSFAAGVLDKAIAVAPAPDRALAYNTAVARLRT